MPGASGRGARPVRTEPRGGSDRKRPAAAAPKPQTDTLSRAGHGRRGGRAIPAPPTGPAGVGPPAASVGRSGVRRAAQG
jgi:hypothetical protein